MCLTRLHLFSVCVIWKLGITSRVMVILVCEANPAGENSIFISTVCVKSVPLYHFKLAYVVLHVAVKKLSKPTFNNGEIGRFNLESNFLTNLENQLQCTAEFVSKVLKDLFSVLIVFKTPKNMSCSHIEQ